MVLHVRGLRSGRAEARVLEAERELGVGRALGRQVGRDVVHLEAGVQERD